MSIKESILALVVIYLVEPKNWFSVLNQDDSNERANDVDDDDDIDDVNDDAAIPAKRIARKPKTKTGSASDDEAGEKQRPRPFRKNPSDKR